MFSALNANEVYHRCLIFGMNRICDFDKALKHIYGNVFTNPVFLLPVEGITVREIKILANAFSMSRGHPVQQCATQAASLEKKGSGRTHKRT